MIYFCATSVIHLLIILFLLETEYKDSKKRNTLILLNHVDNLMACYERLCDSNLLDNIIVIYSDKASHKDITMQINQIQFYTEDILHLFGLEYVSFSLLKYAPVGVTCIYTDEGITSKIDFKRLINIYYHEEWFDGEKFDYTKICEVWMMDARVSCNSSDLKVKDMYMVQKLKDKDMRKRYLEKVKLIFPEEECKLPNVPVVFFDAYYLQMFGKMSYSMEKYLLERLVESVEGFGLIIKPHPGERNYDKYSKMKQYIWPQTFIPWEVIRFYEEERGGVGRKIVIAYNMTGAIMHEKSLFPNSDVHIIVLSKLYDRFSDGSTMVSPLPTHYLDIYGSENLYYPSSFAELRALVSALLTDSPIKPFEQDLDVENARMLEWVSKEYAKAWHVLPDIYNYTTLMERKNNQTKTIQEKKIVANRNGKFEFQFILDHKYKCLTWYIIRKRKILLKLDKIEYKVNELYKKIDLSQIKYNLTEMNADGFYEFLTLDPLLDLEFSEETSEINICGEWIFDDSYEHLTSMYHSVLNRYDSTLQEIKEKLSYYDNHVKVLTKEIDERDCHIDVLHKEIDERDRHINILLNRIQTKDEIIRGIREEMKDIELTKHNRSKRQGKGKS